MRRGLDDLRGVRIALLYGDRQLTAHLTSALEGAGALVAYAAPDQSALDLLHAVDPQVIIVDTVALRASGPDIEAILRTDAQLQWASLLDLATAEIETLSASKLEGVLSRIAAQVRTDRQITQEADFEQGFECRSDRLGPGRLLRAIVRGGGSFRVVIDAMLQSFTIDIADGVMLGAYSTQADGTGRGDEGMAALAALWDIQSARVRVVPSDPYPIVNVLVPLDEALATSARLAAQGRSHGAAGTFRIPLLRPSKSGAEESGSFEVDSQSRGEQEIERLDASAIEHMLEGFPSDAPPDTEAEEAITSVFPRPPEAQHKFEQAAWSIRSDEQVAASLEPRPRWWLWAALALGVAGVWWLVTSSTESNQPVAPTVAAPLATQPAPQPTATDEEPAQSPEQRAQLAPAPPAVNTAPAPAVQEVLKDLPRNAKRASDVLAWRAWREIEAGELDTAQVALDRAWELSRGNARVMAGYAQLQLSRKDADEAIRWARQAVKAEPKRLRYRVIWGDALRLAGDRPAARRMYRKVLRIQPKNRLAARRLRETAN